MELAYQLAEKYVYQLYVTLGNAWDCNEEVTDMIFLGPLERFYALDNNEKMPKLKLPENVYGQTEAAKVDTYAQVAAKYYGWSYQQMVDYFRSGDAYHKETDTVIHGDYGWVCYPQITAVEKSEDNLYKIHYNVFDLDDNLIAENALTARLVNGEYFQFLKNEVNKVK